MREAGRLRTRNCRNSSEVFPIQWTSSRARTKGSRRLRSTASRLRAENTRVLRASAGSASSPPVLSRTPSSRSHARRPLLGREPHAGHALAHLPGDGRLVRSLVDAIVLPHDLGHRGCHRGPAAGEAAALTDSDAAATEPAAQLAQQPRLADPGLAHNANHLAAPGLGSSREVEQHVHLALTPDERDQAGPVGVARHPAPQDAVGDAGPAGLAAGPDEALEPEVATEERRHRPAAEGCPCDPGEPGA